MKAKFRFLLGSLILGLALTLGSAWAAKPEVKFITPATLKGMLGDPALLIIDVGGDWSSSHHQIVGARHYDPEEITSWAPLLPRDKKIVLYCS
ncbi:MAG: hypothetical protein WBQ36_08540 [Desulfobaccales bacterium]